MRIFTTSFCVIFLYPLTSSFLFHICQQPILVAQTVKNCEWSEIFHLFQPGRLACHRFLSASRRYETSGSETKLFITAHTVGNMCFTPIPHVPKSHGDHTSRRRWMLHIEWVYITAEKPEIKKLPSFISSFKQTCPTFPRGKGGGETLSFYIGQQTNLSPWARVTLSMSSKARQTFLKDSPEQKLSGPLF